MAVQEGNYFESWAHMQLKRHSDTSMKRLGGELATLDCGAVNECILIPN